jgi:hypothetical protein
MVFRAPRLSSIRIRFALGRLDPPAGRAGDHLDPLILVRRKPILNYIAEPLCLRRGVRSEWGQFNLGIRAH